MTKVSIENVKRDGQHGTPQDPLEPQPAPVRSKSAPTTRSLHRNQRPSIKETQASVDKSATATPTPVLSARDLRALSRSERLEAQASNKIAAIATAIAPNQELTKQSEVTHGNHTRFDSRSQAPDTSGTHKSRLASQPDQHHSGAQLTPLHLPSSSEEGLRPRNSSHAARDSNLTQVKRTKKNKINFPRPNAPEWTEIDKELAIALPRVFNTTYMSATSGAKAAAKLGDWLYTFFSDKFGVKDEQKPTPHTNRREPRPNRALERLRKQKQDLKKARRALLKAGLQGTEAERLLKARWRTVLRRHNGLRLALFKQQQARARVKAEREFRRDPPKFAHKLFRGCSGSASPTFSKAKAEEYFARTYRDEGRGHTYRAAEEMVRPPPPKHQFCLRPPSVHELSRAARRKRNGAAAGLDGISYVPYKNCPSLIHFLYRLGSKLWKEHKIADDWAQAFIILLKKGSLTEDLDVVSEWRPIAIAATVGKIYLSVIADRLQRFLVHNSYIPRKVQKGFLSGVAGCVEHTFMLYEALKEAKEEQRQIVVAWIDLANAYGSVRHNLIQFALHWYHVPEAIQELVFDYYEKIMARVETSAWHTDFFRFDIGVFQGCVLSAILFICVFQLLLDFLQPLQKKHGFHFKQPDFRALTEAYADDLALISRNANGCQALCDRTDVWLTWSVTMKAKPKKCRSLGWRQFDHRIVEEKFEPVHDLKFSPFDPKLRIAGESMGFILVPENDGFEGRHFKFLGRHIHYFLSEHEIKAKIRKDFIADVTTVARSHVNGLMKLWLYEFYVIRRPSWALMIHDLDVSFARELQSLVQPHLRKWAGLHRSVDPGVLYRSRANFGLQLTSVEQHFVSMQIVKGQLLQASVDENVRAMWKSKESREASMGRLLKVSKLNRQMQSQVELNLLFPSQTSRQGLGHGNFKASHTSREKRQLVSAVTKSIADEKLVQHAHCLSQQGVWTRWHQDVIPFDFSWQNLLYGPGPQAIKFVLNATVNWLKTPDLLKKFGFKSTAYCPLCGHGQCTVHHILSNCKHALKTGRYTWRHDSVLLLLKPLLEDRVAQVNSSPPKRMLPRPILSSFVKAGESKAVPKEDKRCLLDGAADWRLLVDFESESIVFPPEIYSTPERPDIVIWSRQRKSVIMIELTCPAEEGIRDAQARKESRYTLLRERIAQQGWSPCLLTIEAGARGYVARSFSACLVKLGFPSRAARSACKQVSAVVQRCSFAIYLARASKKWAHGDLLQLKAADRDPNTPVA